MIILFFSDKRLRCRFLRILSTISAVPGDCGNKSLRFPGSPANVLLRHSASRHLPSVLNKKPTAAPDHLTLGQKNRKRHRLSGSPLPYRLDFRQAEGAVLPARLTAAESVNPVRSGMLLSVDPEMQRQTAGDRGCVCRSELLPV